MNESVMDKKPCQAPLSPGARAVWDQLDEQTQRTIRKENPFRRERNAAIIELRQRGVKISTLKELTGLGKGGLELIVPTKKRAKDADQDRENQVLNDLKESIESFYNSVSKIINSVHE